jgi:hypothetical protein
MVHVKAPAYHIEVLHDTMNGDHGTKKRCGYVVVNGPTVMGHKYQGHCTYAGKDRAVIDTDSKERAVQAVKDAWEAALNKPSPVSFSL